MKIMLDDIYSFQNDFDYIIFIAIPIAIAALALIIVICPLNLVLPVSLALALQLLARLGCFGDTLNSLQNLSFSLVVAAEQCLVYMLSKARQLVSQIVQESSSMISFIPMEQSHNPLIQIPGAFPQSIDTTTSPLIALQTTVAATAALYFILSPYAASLVVIGALYVFLAEYPVAYMARSSVDFLRDTSLLELSILETAVKRYQVTVLKKIRYLVVQIAKKTSTTLSCIPVGKSQVLGPQIIPGAFPESFNTTSSPLIALQTTVAAIAAVSLILNPYAALPIVIGALYVFMVEYQVVWMTISAVQMLRVILPLREQTGDCVVCMTAAANVLLLPCRHLALCLECYENTKKVAVQTMVCPMCRGPVKEKMKVFRC